MTEEVQHSQDPEKESTGGDSKTTLDPFRNFLQENSGFVDAANSSYQVLGLPEDATWEEIHTKFLEFKKLFSEQLILDQGVDAEKLSQESMPIFSAMYRAYDELNKEREFVVEWIDSATTVVSLLRRIKFLLDGGVKFLRSNSDHNLSLAGMYKYIDQVQRLAFTHIREDVNPEYVILIPDELGIRDLVVDDVHEVQEMLRELDESTELVRIYGLIDTLMAHGYRTLPKINLVNERNYEIDLKRELEIVEEQIAIEEKYRDRPAFLKSRRTRFPQYSFSGPSRVTIP